MGANEYYREKISGSLDLERETLHISDDTGRIVLVDTKTYDGGVIGSPTNEIRYQLGNHLQSASLELDNSAAVISYEEYHPFGTSAYHLGSSSTEVSLKRYRYVGKERDDESGLYYYGARYYAAWLCRFVSVDPLKDDYPMWSSFVYAGNMSVTLTDVNGEGPWGGGETQLVETTITLDDGTTQTIMALPEVEVTATPHEHASNAYSEGITFFQVAMYLDQYTAEIPDYDTAGDTFTIGDYTILPHYVTEVGKEKIAFYIAYREDYIQDIGMEYIISPTSLLEFSENVEGGFLSMNGYTGASNMFHLNRKLDREDPMLWEAAAIELYSRGYGDEALELVKQGHTEMWAEPRVLDGVVKCILRWRCGEERCKKIKKKIR